jgi:hypothetical protein
MAVESSLRVPLSDFELAAWRTHPSTFFGEISRNRTCETVLDLYDFFMGTYTKTPKAKLLEFLAGAPDIDQLALMDQVELASVYCERLAAMPIRALNQFRIHHCTTIGADNEYAASDISVQ